MPQTLDFESDQFLQLLTDALRAGPGSPQWHQAVGRVRAAGGGELDEFKLLLGAREHLESGKSYRSVSPGPEFTRKVLAAVEQESDAKPAGIPTATIVAIGAAVVGLIALGVIGYFLMSGGAAHRPGVEELTNLSFGQAVISPAFDGTMPPAGWKQIGPAPLDDHDALRPAPAAFLSDQAGGIVTAVPLPADQPFAFDVTVKIYGNGFGVIPVVFVTDQPDFNGSGIGSHEFQWVVKDRTPQVVLPDGRFGGTGTPSRAREASFTVRIAMNADGTLVDTGGQRLFAGPNPLDRTKPRYLGVRLLIHGDQKPHKAATVEVESIRVQKP